MAESNGDKTEAPTPRRRQEAREQGNIARSSDLTGATMLIGLMMILRWYGQGIVNALHALVEKMLSPAALSDVGTDRVGTQIVAAIGHVGIAMAPLFIGAMILAIVVNIAQVGLIFNGARIQPNFAALNPLRGLGKLFAGSQSTVHLVMNIMKMGLVGLVAYSAVANRLGLIVSVQQLDFLQIFALGCDVVFAIAIRVGVLLFILALIDYAYQRYQNEQDLKMSKDDVKEEMRRMEGDPKIKQRRRQIQVQRAMQRLKKEVPKADVIVTNPTHFAVALRYDEKEMRAPIVVAKGADFLAFRIREIAIEAGVPIIERPPLARAIFRMVDVGEAIPEEFYATVAEILAYVYELNGKVKRPSTTAA